MKFRSSKLLNLLIFVGVLSALPAFAESVEERGFAIAARSDRSDRGFGDSVVELKMILHDGGGLSSTRSLRIKTLEVPDEQVGDKGVVIFNSPADVKGTALLSHARILEADDQWLYLPKLKKIKRIASVNKSGPFVSSEFAFEDVTAQELNKFSYNYLREEPCPAISNMICDVVERIPKYEYSGYTKQVAWFDQTDFQLRKVDFYDRKKELRKTLEYLDYRKYEEKYWRSSRLVMSNHINNKKTELNYFNYKFGLGLDDNDFEKGVLTRVR